MSSGQITPHPYDKRTVVLASKHQKERVLGPPLRDAVGLQMRVPNGLDTDLLGTFSGEVARRGTPREVALQKARMGMDATKITLGLASEGSFGPHPQLLVVPADYELLAFVDAKERIEVVEQIVSLNTNYAYTVAKSAEDLTRFCDRAGFPSHGLIVRPNSGLQRGGPLFKGITQFDALSDALKHCVGYSDDGLAHVETDMRAHMNPTRQKVLRELAVKLGSRLSTFCPECQTPGWGVVDVVRGLPCEWCGGPTELVRLEIGGCPRCPHRENHPRSDGLQTAKPGNCPSCNP